jgi:hypothetical protein
MSHQQSCAWAELPICCVAYGVHAHTDIAAHLRLEWACLAGLVDIHHEAPDGSVRARCSGRPAVRQRHLARLRYIALAEVTQDVVWVRAQFEAHALCVRSILLAECSSSSVKT